MNKKTVIANWKMAPQNLAEAEQLLDFINEYLETLGDKEECSIIFCPPFVFTEEVGKLLKTSHLSHDAFLGAQDVAIEDAGAFTGEVSGPMLKAMDVRYVIIGHSERRWKLGEAEEVVNGKIKAALRNELIPVVCIGEKTRDDGFEVFLEKQLSETFAGLSADDIEKCIIAYEPVWAISSNPDARPDTPKSALVSINIIKDYLVNKFNVKILPLCLYGGSINSSNALSFLGTEGIDGVLVGGASVRKEEFVTILKAACKSQMD
jgi:triosephosphate isomerase